MALGKNVDEIIPLLENEKQSTLDYYNNDETLKKFKVMEK